MCGIAGIISKNGDASEQVLRMLRSMEHRGADGYGLMVKKDVQKSLTLDGLKTRNGDVAMGHRGLVEGSEIQPFKDCKQKLVLLHNGRIYNYKKLKKELKNHNFVTEIDSEIILHLVEEFYNGDLASAVERTLRYLDGVYAIAVSDGEEIVIARDMVGVKQLYIGENDRYIAFASERKALWEVGISNERRLLPGHIAELSKDGINFKKVLEIPLNQKTSIYDLSEAIESYKKVLVEAVKKRVEELDRVGVVFSGGIDSVLVAKVASEFTDVTCYTAGVKGSTDLEQAKSAASKMGINIMVKELDSKGIEDYIPKVMRAIEERFFVQIEAGIPVYAALEMAHEDGQKVALSGQGPDELFGGYPWYRKVIAKDGYRKLEDYMLDDLQNAYRETLEREVKMAEVNGISLRYPYVDPSVIKLALKIDTNLKIRSADDKLGKFIHREAAKRLGIPDDLAERPKEAAQHGSGVHDVLFELSEKKGFTELAEKLRYDPEKSIREKLGSSVRYGYKYGDKKLWKVPAHLQLYLDTISLEKRLVKEPELGYVEKLLRTL